MTPEHLALAKVAPKGSAMTILLATGCTDQSANVAEHDEEDDTSPAQIVVLRVRAPMPPPSHQCCYPIGEPRTPEFRYCAVPVAHPGAIYCLEHKRLCRRDIAA